MTARLLTLNNLSKMKITKVTDIDKKKIVLDGC
jgi:hypothetical protein